MHYRAEHFVGLKIHRPARQTRIISMQHATAEEAEPLDGASEQLAN